MRKWNLMNHHPVVVHDLNPFSHLLGQQWVHLLWGIWQCQITRRKGLSVQPLKKWFLTILFRHLQHVMLIHIETSIVLLIGCTLPITSAEAERTFSLLCRIKTYIWSSLTEEHVSDMAVIAKHYQEIIPVEDILKASIQQPPRRIFQKSVLLYSSLLPSP